MLVNMIDVLILLNVILLPAVLLWMSWLKFRGVEYVLVNYRWIFVVFFLMPASLVYDLYFYARSWLIFRMNSAPHKHDKKVQHVQQQVINTLIHEIF